MARVRYIGAAPAEVVLNGHPRGGHRGTVQPDQVLDVDDDVYAAHTWPASRWDEVSVPDTGPPAVEPGQFDPAAHSVDDVAAHLATADADEVERVLAAERAGKARKGVLGMGE